MLDQNLVCETACATFQQNIMLCTVCCMFTNTALRTSRETALSCKSGKVPILTFVPAVTTTAHHKQKEKPWRH